MNNKNLILAIVLSTILLWGYAYIVSISSKKTPTTATSYQLSPEIEKNCKKTSLADSIFAPISPPILPTFQAKDIIVDTPIMHIIFNEQGGSIRKILLKEYYMEPEQKGGPFVLLDIKPNNPYTLELNLPQITPQLGKNIFNANETYLKIEPNEKSKKLIFKTQQSGLTIEKIYTFTPDSYAFYLTIRLTNHNFYNLEITPEVTLYDYFQKIEANNSIFTGIEAWCNHQLVEYAANDLKNEPQIENGLVEWIATSIPYFIGVLAPTDKNTNIKYSIRSVNVNNLMAVTLINKAYSLTSGQTQELSFLVFYGPRDLNILENLGHNLTKVVNFGWFDFIAKLMLAAMNFFNNYLGNYGITIIFITILIKFLLWPVATKSYQSIKKMQELQPILAKIKEKYKDDRTRSQQEILQLYKTYKVNPIGGCLPMVIQFPVFIAFYKVLGSAIELRHAPFMLWINDLSTPDRLNIGFNFAIPFIQQGYGLPVLTILMGITMFIQQKITPSTGDPIQVKMMLMMPIFFTFMFLNFPSGLVLYWLIQGILSILQQYWINK